MAFDDTRTLRRKMVKTRALHNCLECMKPIRVGTAALTGTVIYELEIRNYWIHPDCLRGGA